MSEYVVDFGDKSSAFVGLAMALCRKLWGRCATERFVKMVEEQ